MRHQSRIQNCSGVTQSPLACSWSIFKFTIFINAYNSNVRIAASCVFGDIQRRFSKNKSCRQYMLDNPMRCYDSFYNTRCCDTCDKLNTGVTGTYTDIYIRVVWEFKQWLRVGALHLRAFVRPSVCNGRCGADILNI